MVGNIPVSGNLILSPMDGFSDSPYRTITRNFGAALSYTEFISAKDILLNLNKVTNLTRFTELERPITFQIFDDNPERLLDAAMRLQEYSPDILDINMGCSDKQVSNRGAGAGLLQTPLKIATIFSTITKAIDIPVTGKIRLGWDADHKNYLEIARIIEDNGGKLIAVHGRTRAQRYSGKADWEAIAEIKQSVHIPVIANGDVKTAADIQSILNITQCDGVMIGRGAIGNPWIFSKQNKEEIPANEFYSVISKHLNLNIEFYGEEQGIKLFRKHVVRYLQPFSIEKKLMGQLLTTTDPKLFHYFLEDILQNIA